MSRIVLLLILLVSTFAQNVEVKSSLNSIQIQNDVNPSVSVYGALFEIMHKGDISSRVNLIQFDNNPNFFALGALKDLAGEILIIDSKPYISYETDNGKVGISNKFNHQASLLVSASVDDWITLKLPDRVNTKEQLEQYFEEISEEYNLDTNSPFPFMIKGVTSTLGWHIINWDKSDTVHTHQKHIDSGLSGVLKDEPLTVLGFFSKKHKAIFTHHTTFLHMHFITGDKAIAGHVDNIHFGDEQILYIPNKAG